MPILMETFGSMSLPYVDNHLSHFSKKFGSYLLVPDTYMWLFYSICLF